jgi:predicted peroxiredoxin
MEYKGFPPFQEQIKNLKAKGVTLLACPGCLKSWDKGPEDLMEGIQVACKDLFFNFTKGRILTLDY